LEPLAKRILFEDNHLLIVNKLPGEIVQGDKTGDEPLVESLKTYIKTKYNKPGEVFLGVVHRLDRPVSGAVIFARTSKALTRMNALIKERDIRKVYWAICASHKSLVVSRQSLGGTVQRKNNEPAETGKLNSPTNDYRLMTNDWIQIVHYLKKNEQQNKSYIYDHPGEGRLKAELKYRKIASGERYDLIEVELLTGRHHQIRAQLASVGLHIKGDLKYGYPRSNPDGSISLHARMVEFTHPVSRELIRISAPVPEEKLWTVLVNNISC
jgi:23S rRNA pseudouridine1911/1915/1917 synthase